MPDHRLRALTPLGHETPRVDSVGPIKIAEVTTAAMASLALRRGHAGDARQKAESVGLSLPQPGFFVSGDVWTATWTAPDRFLVEADCAAHEDIAGELRAAFADTASVTEQSDGFARFDLTGSHLPRLLERLCPLDFSAMSEGEAASTVIEQMACHVIVRSQEHLTLLVPRSYAGSLHHALTSVATSCFGAAEQEAEPRPA